MIVFKRAADLFQWLEMGRKKGQQIGFVPTMGALHAGHISLIDISKKATSITVCSIFVNPTQFNDPKDFQKYPITLEKDIEMLEAAGADALFLPEVQEVYPGGTGDLEHYALGRLEGLLEGKFRPGHFQGVCQVMRRLLDLVRPDQLFMGQKDYQQCMVVARLLEIMGLKTRLVPCPIIREADGLAMSSRNQRLTASERAQAPVIYEALRDLRDGWRQGVEAGDLTEAATRFLAEKGLRPDYISIADRVSLEPLPGDRTAGKPPKTQDNGSAVVLAAAFLGEIRLIDNMLLDE